MSVQPTIPLGPSDAEVRWADLRAWLQGQIDQEAALMEQFRGHPAASGYGGMVTAYRNTLARMTVMRAAR